MQLGVCAWTLQQRQQQERSTLDDKSSVGGDATTSSADAVVRPASDASQPGASVSSVTTTTTSCDALPARPLIPFGQGWLSGSSKWHALAFCVRVEYRFRGHPSVLSTVQSFTLCLKLMDDL